MSVTIVVAMVVKVVLGTDEVVAAVVMVVVVVVCGVMWCCIRCSLVSGSEVWGSAAIYNRAVLSLVVHNGAVLTEWSPLKVSATTNKGPVSTNHRIHSSALKKDPA